MVSRSLLHRCWSGLLVFLLASPVFADGLTPALRTLNIGVDYVRPAYRAGSKYRTPENLDGEVIEALATKIKSRVLALPVLRVARQQFLTSGKVDALLLRESQSEIVQWTSAGNTVLETGYQARSKLIMRTDTSIKQWTQLKGHSVCLAQGSPYIGRMRALYGAREIVAGAPADTLLALRTGGCDATVHDEVLLNDLLKLPEWKKFSASLPVSGAATRLVWVLRPGDRILQDALSGLATGQKFWLATRKKWVNDVAFEVYLDQNVPDCH